MQSICVLGSINMDLVFKVDRIAKPGETILSKDFKKVPGGKGANQAVAAKRLGANVFMIAKVGMDENGSELIGDLKKDNINVDFVEFSESNPSGMAMITVGDDGNNSIVVVPGANMEIGDELIDKAKDVIRQSKIIISQFETPIEATIKAFKIARESGVTTVLNPAPAKQIPVELIELTDIIVPNETEAFEITKVKVEDNKGIEEASKFFLENGVKFVIITLGERGAVLVSKDKMNIVPAYKVKAVDTTAAGDSFIGALTSKLQVEKSINFESIEKAIKFANKVSAIVVQKPGAQTSLPYLKEVIDVYGEE